MDREGLPPELTDRSRSSPYWDEPRRGPCTPVQVAGSGDGERSRLSNSSNGSTSGGYKIPYRHSRWVLIKNVTCAIKEKGDVIGART